MFQSAIGKVFESAISKLCYKVPLGKGIGKVRLGKCMKVGLEKCFKVQLGMCFKVLLVKVIRKVRFKMPLGNFFITAIGKIDWGSMIWKVRFGKVKKCDWEK